MSTEKARKAHYMAAKMRAAKYVNYVAQGYSVPIAAKKAGLSPSYARSPQFKKTKSWQEMLNTALPDNLLLGKTRHGLEATKPVQEIVDRDPDGKPIYATKLIPDFQVRHKYVETGLKLKGHLSKDDKSEVQVNFSLAVLAQKAAQVRELSPNDIHVIEEQKTLPGAKTEATGGSMLSGLAKLAEERQ